MPVWRPGRYPSTGSARNALYGLPRGLRCECSRHAVQRAGRHLAATRPLADHGKRLAGNGRLAIVALRFKIRERIAERLDGALVCIACHAPRLAQPAQPAPAAKGGLRPP